MKSLIFLLVVLAVVSLTQAQSSSPTVSAIIQKQAIQNFLQSELAVFIQNQLARCEVSSFTDSVVNDDLLKVSVEMTNLKINNFQLPEIQLNLYNGSPLSIAQERCQQANPNAQCVQQGGSYYPACEENFVGDGTSCTVQCPSGFTDNGLYCAKPAPYGRGVGYPWKFGDGFNLDGAERRCEEANPTLGCQKVGLIYYPNCRSGFHNVACCICSPNCPSGWTDIGVSCQKPSNYQRPQYTDYNSNVFDLQLNNIQFQLDADIAVTFDVSTAHGTLSASVASSNFDMRAGLLLSSSSTLQIDFENTSINLGDFDVSIGGSFGTDIENIVVQMVKGDIKNDIENEIANIKSTFQVEINSLMTQLPKSFALGSTGIDIEYSFTQPPQLLTDQVQIDMDLNIMFNQTVNSINAASTQTNVVSAQAAQSEQQNQQQSAGIASLIDQVELNINQSLLEQILTSAVQAGLVKYDITSTSAFSYFSLLGLNVTQANITMTQIPQIEIMPNNMSLLASINLNMYAKTNTMQDFGWYTIVVDALALGNAQIIDNALNLTITGGQLKNLSGEILYKAGVNVSEMVVLINDILVSMLPKINGAIPKIPIPQLYGVILSNPILQLQSEIISVQATPQYNTTLLQYNMQNFFDQVLSSQSEIVCSSSSSQQFFSMN